jgi:hypothetical protein
MKRDTGTKTQMNRKEHFMFFPIAVLFLGKSHDGKVISTATDLACTCFTTPHVSVVTGEHSARRNVFACRMRLRMKSWWKLSGESKKH